MVTWSLSCRQKQWTSSVQWKSRTVKWGQYSYPITVWKACWHYYNVWTSLNSLRHLGAHIMVYEYGNHSVPCFLSKYHSTAIWYHIINVIHFMWFNGMFWVVKLIKWTITASKHYKKKKKRGIAWVLDTWLVNMSLLREELAIGTSPSSSSWQVLRNRKTRYMMSVRILFCDE